MEVKIPLLHDSHNHASLYAALAKCHDISEKGPKDALDFLYALPKDRLSVVKGWKSFELELGQALLKELPPLLAINFSLHGFVMSDSGLSFAAELVPELHEKRHDLAWSEANVPAIFKAYASLSNIDEEDLVFCMDKMLCSGVASSDEMTVPSREFLELCMNSRYRNRLNLWTAPSIFRELDKQEQDSLSGIKLYLDGAIGSSSAAIKGPWLTEGTAFFVYKDEELDVLVQEAAQYRTGVAIHAIGELAIEQAIKSIEKANRLSGTLKRARIEHAQFISLEQARKAREQGIILSMQPNFTSDCIDYADRLPLSYLKANNPFRMLIDEAGFVPGEDLVFGSDGMPGDIAYAIRWSLFPPFASQYLSLDELVAGYGMAIGCKGHSILKIDEKHKTVKLLHAELDG